MESHRPAHGLMLADALVAATALEAGAALLTANAKDYRPLDGLALLTFKP